MKARILFEAIALGAVAISMQSCKPHDSARKASSGPSIVTHHTVKVSHKHVRSKSISTSTSTSTSTSLKRPP